MTNNQKHIFTDSSHDGVAADWTMEDAKNAMAYITYFKNGETSYNLVSGTPDTNGEHRLHAGFHLNAQGQVTDVFMGNIRDGHLFDIDKEKPQLEDAKNQRFLEMVEEKLGANTQCLLDMVNIMQTKDAVIRPADGRDIITAGDSVKTPLELKSTVQDFLAGQIEKQALAEKKTMGLQNMREITQDTQRLSAIRKPSASFDV